LKESPIAATVQGNTQGLKPSTLKALNRLSSRRYSGPGGLSPDQARELAALSLDTGRQIGLLIDRSGRPDMVIVGDPGAIFIPELPRSRLGAGRLRGLRLLHTHLRGEKITHDDLMDMIFLRLDSVTALTLDSDGLPEWVHFAHILPPNPAGKAHEILEPVRYERWEHQGPELSTLTSALEEELARESPSADAADTREKALLVSVSTKSKARQESALTELASLAETAGLAPAGTMTQRVEAVNPKHILGKGKLAELEVQALRVNAQVIVFDQDLSPTQARNLAEITERKILDRTQLILDIFAGRAKSREGKLQVEMAQLKYTLPRLVGKNDALSRLMGGIGGRGPGETKLEIDRRRAKERLSRLKNELGDIRRRRGYTRARRSEASVPVVALVGYTNAGKSTLLNTLTGSGVLAEDKLFATLDPTSRRIRFPRDREIVLTDTVGFIRRLPPDLKEAFTATLEELHAADLLVHVADASHPEAEEQIAAVKAILEEMGLHETPTLLVLNKWDRLSAEGREQMANAHPGAVPAQATQRGSLTPLVDAILLNLPRPAGTTLASEVSPIMQ
jgi:GTP-binding protein HflX